jgi:hypothetical protein
VLVAAPEIAESGSGHVAWIRCSGNSATLATAPEPRCRAFMWQASEPGRPGLRDSARFSRSDHNEKRRPASQERQGWVLGHFYRQHLRRAGFEPGAVGSRGSDPDFLGFDSTAAGVRAC